MRHESRGLHYSRDYPHTLPVSFPTVLTRARRRSGAELSAPRPALGSRRAWHEVVYGR